MLFWGLIGWLGVAYLTAFVAARATPGQWYAELSKPAWNPPDWVFGPVWSVLYTLMAVAAWLVWSAPRGPVLPALGAFLVQLAFNALWSWLFFGWHRMGWALVEIALLWCAIAVTAWLFWQVRPLAGALLIPYLGWVTFAAAINLSLNRLNRRPSERSAL